MVKKIFWASVFIILFALVAAGGFMAGKFYAGPLAEPMVIQPAQQDSTTNNLPKQLEAEPAQSAKPEGACGETGAQFVLFTGADFSMGNPPLGADAIRLARIDYDAKKIVVVAFPRDLLVQTPGLADLDISQSALGLAFQSRKEDTKGDSRHKVTVATELLAQTLVENFGYPTNAKKYDYLTLQLDEIGAMIDTIGGVPIDLPESITTERNVTFPAGQQTLDGALSAEYVRSKEPGGDYARLQRQNLYMTALQAQVLNVGLLPKIPDLYKQFDKAIVTSLSPKQLQSLACMSEAVPLDKIEFHEISLENALVTQGEGELLVPTNDKIKAALKEWFGE